MAAKFIELFDIKDILSESDVDWVSLEKVALDGGISAILDLSEIFPTIDFLPYLDIATKVQLEKNNLDIVLQNYDKLEIVLKDKRCLIRKALIAAAPKTRLKNIQKIINSFDLGEDFKNSSKITSYNLDKGYGFMVDVFTGESLFFKKDAFIPIGDKDMPMVGQIAFYSRTIKVDKLNNPYRKNIANNILINLDTLDSQKLSILAKTSDLNTFALIADAAPQIDLTKHINCIFDELVAKGDYAQIATNKNLVSKLIEQEADLVFGMLIKASSNIGTRKLQNLIKIFSLETKFIHVARVTRYDDLKKYGFAIDLLSGESIFFHVKDAFSNIKTLKTGSFIKYNSLKYDPKYAAKQALEFIQVNFS